MRRNLFVRLLGLFLGVAVFSIAATAWITTQSTSNRLRGQFERTLEADSYVYQELLLYGLGNDSWDDVAGLVSDLAERTGSRVALTDGDGVMLADLVRRRSRPAAVDPDRGDRPGRAEPDHGGVDHVVHGLRRWWRGRRRVLGSDRSRDEPDPRGSRGAQPARRRGHRLRAARDRQPERVRARRRRGDVRQLARRSAEADDVAQRGGEREPRRPDAGCSPRVRARRPFERRARPPWSWLRPRPSSPAPVWTTQRCRIRSSSTSLVCRRSCRPRTTRTAWASG